MTSHRLSVGRVALAAAWLPLFVIAAATGHAAPAADSQGYVDSTARCTAPAAVVVFGSTGTSRVAICRDSAGDYQYRGVRVTDGARLILPAVQSGAGTFTAENDGIEYEVNPDALVISSGQRLIREEPMLDFHSSGVTGAGDTADATPTQAPATPLPPPLPAEVGGADS